MRKSLQKFKDQLLTIAQKSIMQRVVASAILLFNCTPIFAQNWNQIIKAAASDRLTKNSAARANTDNYGYSVAMDGNYAIVGIYQEDEDTTENSSLSSAGSAIILYNNSGNWTQIKKLTAANNYRLAGDNFGFSVAISGDYAIVGAPNEDEDDSELNTKSGAGSAYIFKKNQGGTANWGLLKKITPANANRLADDQFGRSVAISGDYAIIGAYTEDEDENEANPLSAAGSAYIFKKDQGGTDFWGLLKKVTPPNRLANDQFGFSVAISGIYAIVGAYLEDEDESEANTKSGAGSAYIFKKDQGGTDNWGQIKKITPVNANRLIDDNFGYSVTISGDYTIVGAYQEDEDENEANTKSGAGSAYIFKKDQGGTDNWGLIKKLTPANANRFDSDFFGRAVGIDGSYAIVGAYLEDEDENEINTLSNAGSAYIFKKDYGGNDNWGLLKKLTRANANRLSNDQFGISVAISGDYTLVGAHQEDEDENETNTKSNAGAAYIFNKDQGGTDNWGLLIKTVFIGRVQSDNYGYRVAIDGNYAIVGANLDDEDASGLNVKSDAGSAYLLKNTNGTWAQLKKLTPSNANRLAGDGFGYTIAISGDYAIVGAPFEDEDNTEANTKSSAGSAYIFKKDYGGTDNWGLIKKITPENANRFDSDYFGRSISMSGDYAIVGAPFEDEDDTEANTKTDAGSAYIFKKDYGGADNWGLLKKITPANTNRLAADNFGTSVAISSDYAIVGAPNEDEDDAETNTKSAAGSAYIFKKDQGGSDNWGLLKKITPANANRLAADIFGTSIAINGNYVIVGAQGEDEDDNEINTLSNAGSAYIFKKDQGGSDNWGLLKKITPTNRLANDFFGYSVSVSGDYTIIGAPFEDEDDAETNTKSTAGSAYIFKKDQGGTDNWGLFKKITPADANRLAGDNFGWHVAISGNYTVIGAYTEDDDASESNTLTDAGSAYIFYNGCHPLSTLPTAAGTTYTSSYKETDALGWTHYCTNADQLLLSLKIGSSGAVVNATEVQLKTGSSSTFSSSSSGGMITNTGGYAIIDRRWEVSPTTQPSSGNVGVKYYFTNAEYTAEVAALAALASPSTVTNVNQLNMYKATSGATFANPHTVNGIILTHGATPSTSVWLWAQKGVSDHSAEYEVASFSGGGGGFGGGGGPLPVTLTTFTGKLIKSDAVLLWTTATETNNDRFEIERSIDGKLWTSTGTVKGNGNSSQLSHYIFKDLNVVSLPNSYVYYRLKQLDYNGAIEYSDKVKINLDKAIIDTKVLVSPNPFKNELAIAIPESENQELGIKLSTVFGSKILNMPQTKTDGGLIILNTENLPAGLYILSVDLHGTLSNYKIMKR